jgi:flagellar FliL protein
MADDEEDDDDEEEDDDDEEEGGEGRPSKGGGRNKLFLLIGVAVLVLVVGDGAAAYFTGMLDSMFASDDAADVEGELDPRVGQYHELPEMVVSLRSGGRRRAPAIKLRVTLELARADDEDIMHIEQVTPRILDEFQNRVREMSLKDIRGATGPYLLREILLAKVIPLAKPVKVLDVLITSVLVQ